MKLTLQKKVVMWKETFFENSAFLAVERKVGYRFWAGSED